MTPCIAHNLDQISGKRALGIHQLSRSGFGGGLSSIFGRRVVPGYENDYEDAYDDAYEDQIGHGFNMYGYEMDGRHGMVLKEKSLHITPTMVPLNMERIPAPSCNAVIPFLEGDPSVGTVKLSANYQYDGELVNGVPNGMGAMTDLSTNKIVYKGEWKDGKYNGMGLLYFEDTRIEEGLFYNGELVEGKCFLPSGTLHIGHFYKRKLDGQGRIVLPSGMMVEGIWDAGQPVGEMTYTFANGEIRTYDIEKRINYTGFEIYWNNESILYINNQAEALDVEHLYYFNGDVFMGGTQQGKYPLHGYYFKYLTKSTTYSKMKMGQPRVNIEVFLKTISGKYKRIEVSKIEKI